MADVLPSQLVNSVMGKLFDVLTNGDETVPRSLQRLSRERVAAFTRRSGASVPHLYDFRTILLFFARMPQTMWAIRRIFCHMHARVVRCPYAGSPRAPCPGCLTSIDAVSPELMLGMTK